MRLKYYLRGLGLGIIFAAIVLTVAFALQGNSISDDEVIERAKKLGMVMEEDKKESLFSTEKDTETSAVPKTTEADTQKTEPVKNTENDTEVSKKDDASKSTEADSEKETEKDSEKDKDSKYVTIKVKKGEVCREVAEDLQRNGLVKDAEEFRKYMGNNGYAKFIKGGTFKIPRGASFQEIARILMKK